MPNILSPAEKLKKRIEREITKKKLIGDINISDDEFELLKQMLRNQYGWIRTSSSHLILSATYCVALVQIGIRYYNSNFWGQVQKVLGIAKLDGNTQRWMGESFIKSLQKYGKLFKNGSDYVNTILMHGILSNYYSSNFFEFLFAFYRLDLERDISRLDRQTMNDLVDVIERNDNTARTYNVRQHTADATSINRQGMKNRYRRYINLMDKAFMGEQIPVRSANRIIQNLIEWMETSDKFRQDRSENGGKRGRGRKSFTAPYLKYLANSKAFQLVIPPQLIRLETVDNLTWKIDFGRESRKIEINPYMQQGITGYKTETEIIDLAEEDIFEEITVRLMQGDTSKRYFRIPGTKIRFFDANGDLSRNDSLREGRYDSFTRTNFIPISDAIQAQYKWGNLLCTSYEFETGDIISFPDGKPLSIGKKLTEGLMLRGLVEKTVAFLSEQNKIGVYNIVPSIFIKMPQSRRAGSLLYINGTQYRLRDEDVPFDAITEIDLKDRSGECGYLLHLKDFNVQQAGIYEVCLDVPNEYAARKWMFAYIPNFSFYFEGAPYLFQSAGTFCLPAEFHAKVIGGRLPETNAGITSYTFDIVPSEVFLHMNIQGMDIGVEIPSLSYSFDGNIWQTMPHKDIWHTDFQPTLYIKYDTDQVFVGLEANINDEQEEEHLISVYKNRTENIFKCDLNPFKSWLNRDMALRRIFLRLPGTEKDTVLANIITRSTLLSGVLVEEPNESVIKGEFDIVGHADYYVDLYFNKTLILDKEPLNDGRMLLNTKIRSGRYEAVIYEMDADDSGFSTGDYYEIGRQEVQMLSPTDLSGKDLKVLAVYRTETPEEQLLLNRYITYKIIDLRNINEEDVHNYIGYIFYEDDDAKTVYYQKPFQVNIYFPNLNNITECAISFMDEGERAAFLYDSMNHIIVREEKPGLRKREKYRRYNQILYEDEYTFRVEFVEDPRGASIRAKKVHYIANGEIDTMLDESLLTGEITEKSRLDEVGLSMALYDYLAESGIETVGALKAFFLKYNAAGLQNIRGLSNNMRNQIILFAVNNGILE